MANRDDDLPADEPPPRPTRARRRPSMRWLIVALGFVLVAAAAGAYVWFERIPGYRPALEPGERYGIDVSNHQGTIDWRRVARDDIHFAYIKATEGGDFVDSRFSANWQGAGEAGLDRGAYHFFTLCRSGADQADNFLRTVPRDGAALAPAVDLEFVGNCAARPSRDDLLRELKTFVDRVESSMARPVMLYVMGDFDDQYHVRQELHRAYWVLSFLHRPDVDDWTVWQISGEANVEGIEGPVDINVMRPSG